MPFLFSEEGERLLTEIPSEHRVRSWQIADGQRTSAGDAFVPLFERLPYAAPLAAAARAFPGTAKRVYWWVTRHRERFGRWLGQNACSVDPSRHRPGAGPVVMQR